MWGTIKVPQRVRGVALPSGERLYTVAQVADALSYSKRSIQGAIRRGELKGIKLMGRKGGWRVSRSALDAWLYDRT